jgi:hypothetical protein
MQKMDPAGQLDVYWPIAGKAKWKFREDRVNADDNKGDEQRGSIFPQPGDDITD